MYVVEIERRLPDNNVYLKIGFIPNEVRLIRWSVSSELHTFISAVFLAPHHHLFHDAQMIIVLVVPVAVCHSLWAGQLKADEALQETLCEEIPCPAVEEPSPGDFIATLQSKRSYAESDFASTRYCQHKCHLRYL